MIQKAWEKHSNTFIVIHVFKQTWRWNYDSMNVSGYGSVIGKWRMCWGSTTLEGWILYTTTNKGNNNKNPRQVWSRCNGAKCAERSVRKKEKLHWCADAVMQVFAQSPKKSLRQCSREIGIQKSSVHRILRAQKWKPYIPRLAHALNEDDSEMWLEFCEWFLCKCDEREDFQDSTVWSDKATFKVNGTINRHISGYGSNPNIVEEKTVNLPGVAVWCGLSS